MTDEITYELRLNGDKVFVLDIRSNLLPRVGDSFNIEEYIDKEGYELKYGDRPRGFEELIWKVTSVFIGLGFKESRDGKDLTAKIKSYTVSCEESDITRKGKN